MAIIEKNINHGFSRKIWILNIKFSILSNRGLSLHVDLRKTYNSAMSRLHQCLIGIDDDNNLLLILKISSWRCKLFFQLNHVFTQSTLNTVCAYMYVRTSDYNWVRINWEKTYRSLSTGQSSMIWYPSQSFTLFISILAISYRYFTVLLHLESTVSLKLYIFQRFGHISKKLIVKPCIEHLKYFLESKLWKNNLIALRIIVKKSPRFQEP